jgi:hypothetical protein
MTCQLCGYTFDATQMSCHASCALHSYCKIVCCPNCGYQAVDESRSRLAHGARRLAGLVNRSAQKELAR